ncbi:TIGR02530 family flagellar biosynthesis protein [Halalkalibacter sp. AB-rgal2]|uniref:TIGR02530 family flagellar biosynthesis protein n=1 Tax=Halalkalibacter sp. AB-rgal2 TaxID=3242695 RepID=UPI00359EFD65
MDPRVQWHPLPNLPKSPNVNTNDSHAKKKNFKEVFQTELNNATKLVFTKHAKNRMESRGISIDDNKWIEIENKVVEARKKGIKESVVITEDATLLINAQTHTIITALNRNEAKSQIFSNINGTILID